MLTEPSSHQYSETAVTFLKIGLWTELWSKMQKSYSNYGNQNWNIFTFYFSHILLCTKVAHGCIQYLDCSVLTIFWGYWLAITWYCLAITWLLAGYWLPMSKNQYTSRHSHILLRTKVEYGWYTLDCGVFMSYFGYRPAIVWLYIGWLLVGMSQNQYTSKHILHTKVAQGCYQYFGLYCVHKIFWLSTGYRVAIGWLCPKINTL